LEQTIETLQATDAINGGVDVTKMVAIGGSLLKGDTLIVGSMVATWNDTLILYPLTVVLLPGLLDYDNNGGDRKYWWRRFDQQKELVHVTFMHGWFSRGTFSPGKPMDGITRKQVCQRQDRYACYT